MALGMLAAPCPVLQLPPLPFSDAVIRRRKMIVVVCFLWFSPLTFLGGFKKNPMASPSGVAALQGMLGCT